MIHMKISVTILTKNSEKYLEEVLTSVKAFDEVLIYDTGSIDNTFAIASKYSNVTIFKGSMEGGFGVVHNKASSLAKNDWILSLDSDEMVTDDMLQAIQQLDLDPSAAYSFPRHN